jgi:hypothetical protein
VPQSEQNREVFVLSNEQRGHFISLRPLAWRGIEYKFGGEESNEKEKVSMPRENFRFSAT